MKIKTSSFQEWKAQSFFSFPFKGHFCYYKSLEITGRSVEAMKKENFAHSKKKVSVKRMLLKPYLISSNSSDDVSRNVGAKTPLRTLPGLGAGTSIEEVSLRVPLRSTNAPMFYLFYNFLAQRCSVRKVLLKILRNS